MSYKLLIKKLWFDKKKIITREEIRSHSKGLKLPYNLVIGYLLSNNYIVRILRGIFYVKSIEERKNNTINISFYDAVSEALKLKKVINWYFGLETALKLNNLTHEYFTIDYIISDKLKGSKPIEIIGHKVKFLRIKENLTKFGINKGKLPYSDVEKTILDMVYLGIYNNLSENEIKNKVIEYLSLCNKVKLVKYGEYYPKTVFGLIQRIKP